MKPSSLPLSICADQLREHSRDRFLLTLFVPARAREELTALYALEMELDHVQGAVREEMIGHIRYAWWQEAIEGLYDGKPARGHPVLEALKPMIEQGHLPKAEVLALVDIYRANLPQLPPDSAARTDHIADKLMDVLAPEKKKAWRRAMGIIERHRKRHPSGANGRLALALFMAAYLP